MKLLRYIFKHPILINKRFYVKCGGEFTSKWIDPEGFDSGLTVYNPVNKKKVKLKTKNEGVISWYACGPTVYDSAHIGHACCYLYQDIIRRIMEDMFKLKVIYIMGVTDIDDKIIAAATSYAKDITAISRHYENEFFSDLSSLNIKSPTLTARVTDYIPEIISFIHKLIVEGFAYTASDGSVYFRVDKCNTYGKLRPAGEMEGETDDFSGKESNRDFALWKGAKDGEPSWKAPWGLGRPGWHIECSTIASCLVGKTLDIHSGGVDLAFPHHENEEAQSCCYHGVHQWVNYWIHTGHICQAGDVKMSKSLKNTISISQFLKKYSSYELRMFCLLTRYRTGSTYSEAVMENAVSICRKFVNFFNDCDSYVRGERSFGCINESVLLQSLCETEKSVLEAVSNDFDTPRAVSYLIHLVSLTNKMLHESTSSDENVRRPVVILAAVSKYVRDTLNTFGCQTESQEIRSSEVVNLLDSSILFRTQVRKTALKITKNDPKESRELKKVLLKHCDEFRNDLLSDGIELKDHGDSTTWSILEKQRNSSIQSENF